MLTLRGHMDSRGPGGMDAWAFAVDSSGEILWDRIYGEEGTEIAFGIAATNDHGFVLAGSTTPAGSEQADAWVFKIDAQGGEVWSRVFDNERDGGMHAIGSTPDGGFLVAGDREEDTWVMSLDSQGVLLWERVFHDEGQDLPVGVVQTSDGGIGIVEF